VLYNISAAGLGLAGHLNPLLAAILMPLSSLATMSLVAWTFWGGKREREAQLATPGQQVGTVVHPV
jgi:Cu2+-exporting ATPase